MKRTGKRNKSQKSQRGRNAPSAQMVGIGQNLNAAVQHHQAGRILEAEKLYRQVLQVDPKQPDALYLLGLIALQSGHHNQSLELLTQAISITPERFEAHNALGQAYAALQDFERSFDAFRKAVELQSDYIEAHFNLGNVYNECGQYENAVASFEAVLKIKPDVFQAHNNLGVALTRLGRTEQAMESYRNALSINPKFAQSIYGLVDLLKTRGELDQAIEFVEQTLKTAPGEPLILDLLAELLNHHDPRVESNGNLVLAHKALQAVHFEHIDDMPITDEMVVNLYKQGENILDQYDVLPLTQVSQLWRGEMSKLNCPRHMKVFRNFNAIPEFCFDCFKLSVTVPSVMDLFKLAWVFDGIKLPHDNTRKCHIELRAQVKGAYKGLIYCDSFEEAQQLQQRLQNVLDVKITSNIDVDLKRGCSEFPLAYPEYNQFDDHGQPVMSYNKDWRPYEDIVDQSLSGQLFLSTYNSYNHSGLSLHDVRIMRHWLAYAASIGDSSYELFSSKDLPRLNLSQRPPFVENNK
ncbi:MAG: tetratricopeptide repeat protein [Magnetovibrio sp.]|nr:tetratricopeptide repeat protein [Magnetovibrio sp.]